MCRWNVQRSVYTILTRKTYARTPRLKKLIDRVIFNLTVAVTGHHWENGQIWTATVKTTKELPYK